MNTKFAPPYYRGRVLDLFERKRICVPDTFVIRTVKGNYTTLLAARLDLQKALARLEQDRQDWQHVKRTVVDDPLTSALNPLEQDLMTEFLRYGELFEKETQRLMKLSELFAHILEN